jgi:hypothetical protein
MTEAEFTTEVTGQLVGLIGSSPFLAIAYLVYRLANMHVDKVCSAFANWKPDIHLTVRVDGPVHIVNHEPDELESERVVYPYRRTPTLERE